MNYCSTGMRVCLLQPLRVKTMLSCREHECNGLTCNSDAACWAAGWLGPALRHAITDARQPPRHTFCCTPAHRHASLSPATLSHVPSCLPVMFSYCTGYCKLARISTKHAVDSWYGRGEHCGAFWRTKALHNYVALIHTLPSATVRQIAFYYTLSIYEP